MRSEVVTALEIHDDVFEHACLECVTPIPLLNAGYEVSLEPRKVYEVLRDPIAANHGQLRVDDESGEDYLYPQSHFAQVVLPRSIRKAVLAAG